MPLEDRLESLRTKHASLETALRRESHRPYPDSETVLKLKREKLRVKDEMQRLVPVQYPAAI
jgi:hypothetical protein